MTDISDNPDALLEGHLYKLVGKKAVPCSFEEYIVTMKSPDNRIIEQNQVDDLLVSTIFTGIDRAFGHGEKKLFEVTVFGLENDLQPCWRYATYNQAVREHRRIVLLLQTQGKSALMAEVEKHI